MFKNLASCIPKNKSERKNKITASQKTLKYMIPNKAKITDTQNGKNSIEINNNKETEILITITLYYTEYVRNSI